MDSELILREIEKTLDYADRVAPRFRWGRADCLTVHSGIVKRAGGPDIGAEYVGRYKTQEDLNRLLPKGLAFEIRRRAKELGWQSVKPSEAPIGSWGVARMKNGVCVNLLKYKGDYWIAIADRGVDYVLSSEVRLAWRPPAG